MHLVEEISDYDSDYDDDQFTNDAPAAAEGQPVDKDPQTVALAGSDTTLYIDAYFTSIRSRIFSVYSTTDDVATSKKSSKQAALPDVGDLKVEEVGDGHLHIASKDVPPDSDVRNLVNMKAPKWENI